MHLDDKWVDNTPAWTVVIFAVPIDRAGSRLHIECGELTLKIAKWTAIFVGVVLLAYVVWHYVVVDPCLDKGGAWNYAAFRCDGINLKPR